MLQQIVSTYCNRFQVHPLRFKELPNADLSLIITIPSFKEPDILTTLRSLGECNAPTGSVELIIVINAGEDAGMDIRKVNEQTVQQIQEWIRFEQPACMNTFIIREENIPTKNTGAGMARKIGMDEAVQRWAMIGKDGPIVCLDADCTVSSEYLRKAEKKFLDPKINVGHFQFEHLYDREPDLKLKQGILHYELHLRCHVEGLRQAGFPNAIHTVGSCMVVRASAYAKAGGMNKRKAGEDFYFLHKLIPLGGWTIIPAIVYPSCRISDRVPFGTGRSQKEWVKDGQGFNTYSAAVYDQLKILFKVLSNSYESSVEVKDFPAAIQDYLTRNSVVSQLDEIRSQSNTPVSFQKRLWQWMDGFRVLKITHFLRDNGFPNNDVKEVSRILLDRRRISPGQNLETLLEQFRELDSVEQNPEN